MKRSILGIFALFFLVTGCGPVDASKDFGSLSRECYPNGTCNTGLVCEEGFCQLSQADATNSGDMFGTCEAGTGCFGSTCTADSECEANVCTAHMGDFLCTMECTDECPPGWSCRTPEGSDQKVCVSNVPQICQPCLADDECGALDVSGRCVDYGDEGSFCSVQCSLDSDCPQDYICDAMPGDTDDSSKYCINLSGTCSCSISAMNDAKETTCAISNEFGRCEGTRACTNSGLSECTANTPSLEICDGIDNDCNGETDEANSSDTKTWFKDGDEDGYGDPTDTIDACEAPEGYVENALDCDDNNNSINPDAVEVCDDADNNCNEQTDEDGAEGATAWYHDKDGDGHGNLNLMVTSCNAPDGHVALSNDCNDTDASAYPDAPEYCDGIDNNCDGETDEGEAAPQTYYADFDADGYGTEEITSTGCGSPPNYVLVKGDCNDFNGAIHPEALEVCDEVDNNCDGAIDEGDAAPSIFFADFDQDGYGSNTLSVTACSAPTNYISVSGDCDDFEPLSNPEASEICDGQDNNCNSAVDEGVTTTLYQDTDGDGYGVESESIEGCGLILGYSFQFGDCNDSNVLIHPNAYELCDGVDNNCNSEPDENPINGLTFYADTDGDGYGDSASPINACEASEDLVSNALDCDDDAIDINPLANEIYYDGTDQNCDNKSDFDQDEDGHDSIDFGGDDINDLNAFCFDFCPDGSTQATPGVTCKTILENFPGSPNDTYWIDPDKDGDTSNAVQVYCDMAGGGWTYASLLTPFHIPFTGDIKSVVSPNVVTEFRFTVFGAQGGHGVVQSGGMGGSSVGHKLIEPGSNLYFLVGGRGQAGGNADEGPCNSRLGGFNGGGTGSQGGSGGGGASDVRLDVPTLANRIIVAGGGGGVGGASGTAKGGDGGGLNGQNGGVSSQTDGQGGTGGTQDAQGISLFNASANGFFGQGGDAVQCNDEGGGGGGWWGGAAGGFSNTSGGGGSGFVGGMDFDTSTIAGMNTGDGYIEYIFR